MPISDEQLKPLLVQAQVLNDQGFDELVQQAHQSNESVIHALVKKELISDADLGKLIAAHYQAPFVQLSQLDIPEQILLTIPREVAHRYKTIAFARDSEGIKLATSEFGDNTLAELVSKKTGLPVTVHYATELDIENTLVSYRKDLQQEFEKLLQEDNQVLSTQTNDPPVQRMVDVLIQAAYHDKASDIHIEPQEHEFIVRFRIDGLLHEVLNLPKNLHDRIVTRIKVDNNGSAPAGIPVEDPDTPADESLPIGANTADPTTVANLCSLLVPEYIAALPTDPQSGITPVTDCATDHNTGYRISQSETDARITVTAVGQNTPVISVTR